MTRMVISYEDCKMLLTAVDAVATEAGIVYFLWVTLQASTEITSHFDTVMDI